MTARIIHLVYGIEGLSYRSSDSKIITLFITQCLHMGVECMSEFIGKFENFNQENSYQKNINLMQWSHKTFSKGCDILIP